MESSWPSLIQTAALPGLYIENTCREIPELAPELRCLAAVVVGRTQPIEQTADRITHVIGTAQMTNLRANVSAPGQ